MQNKADVYSLDESAHAVSGAVYTLKHGDAFAGFDAAGNAAPEKEATGLFRHDTQLVSRWQVMIDGAAFDHAEISSSRTSLAVTGRMGDCTLRRDIAVCNGRILEKITLENTGRSDAEAMLHFDFGTDFKDIFGVRGDPHLKTGQTEVAEGAQTISFTHHGVDGQKRDCAFSFSEAPQSRADCSALFPVRLAPGETREIVLAGGVPLPDDVVPTAAFFDTEKQKAQEDYETIYRRGAWLESGNPAFDEWLKTSQADLAMLLSPFEGEDYPWAGIPWFATMFGRDAVVTALEVLAFKPEIAKSVLTVLGKYQATAEDSAIEAEKGKVFHEMRRGESSKSGQNPFACYYGGVDTTPLYVMLAGEYHKRTDDTGFIRTEWPHLEAALDWLITCGDADTDGFITHRIPEDRRGLTVQSWMDSGDSMFHADGTLPTGPLAVCEVQGFAYAAFREGEKMAALLGMTEKAAAYKMRAETLKKTFNEKFWSDELGTYVRALDGSGDDKKPCTVKGSNPGQLLLTGIVPPERAKKVVAALMAEDSFSGFGIRTLSSDQPRYDDLGYHRGTVWPHDNALIAMGMARAGFRAEALELMQAQFTAAAFFPDKRLPELFGGAVRKDGKAPQLYPASCSPQAWAAGAALLFLEVALGLVPDPKTGQVNIRKDDLPDYLGEIRISNLPAGGKTHDITVAEEQPASVRKNKTRHP